MRVLGSGAERCHGRQGPVRGDPGVQGERDGEAVCGQDRAVRGGAEAERAAGVRGAQGAATPAHHGPARGLHHTPLPRAHLRDLCRQGAALQPRRQVGQGAGGWAPGETPLCGRRGCEHCMGKGASACTVDPRGSQREEPSGPYPPSRAARPGAGMLHSPEMGESWSGRFPRGVAV